MTDSPEQQQEAKDAARKYAGRALGLEWPRAEQEAFLAGASWERSRTPEAPSEDAQRALRLQAMLYGRIEYLVSKDPQKGTPEGVEIGVLGKFIDAWERAEFPHLSQVKGDRHGQ